MKKWLFYILSILGIVLLCSCANGQQESYDNRIASSATVSTKGPIMLDKNEEEFQPETQGMNSFYIYTLTQVQFQQYVMELSDEVLNEYGVLKTTYTQDSRLHGTANGGYFPIKAEFISLVTNEEIMKAYLSKYTEIEEIEDIAVIDSPNRPMTIWINTGVDDFFVTVSTNAEDEYNYTFYTKSDFLTEYGTKEAVLLVNGVEVKSEIVPRTYADDADIPMLTVLEAIGATVEWQNETSAVVTYLDGICVVDIEKPTFFKADNINDNLLFKKMGGATVVYSTGEDLMVDIETLLFILNQMGGSFGVRVSVDRSTVSVYRRLL